MKQPAFSCQHWSFQAKHAQRQWVKSCLVSRVNGSGISIPVVPGQAGGGSFQKEKNYIAQKEFAYRMCARRPTSAMPKSFLCCERAFCRSIGHLIWCDVMACVVSCHVMQCDVMVMSCTTPVLLCTTKYYSVLQILLCTTPVLPCTTKYYSSTTLYYSSTTL